MQTTNAEYSVHCAQLKRGPKIFKKGKRMEKKGTLGQKRRPKGDPNPQKGPLGDPGPLKGTRLGTVHVAVK